MSTTTEILDSQKITLFPEFGTLEEAMNHAYVSLEDSHKADITGAILTYHNTLINELKRKVY
jgi:hypothetical protein|tara:strand:- start:1637 stop:1822 length:186 start_codon:yes stop_codon:yes gene_type:complete